MTGKWQMMLRSSSPREMDGGCWTDGGTPDCNDGQTIYFFSIRLQGSFPSFLLHSFKTNDDFVRPTAASAEHSGVYNATYHDQIPVISRADIPVVAHGGGSEAIEPKPRA